ncbi:hypothetical protein GCM10010452_61480 [Crossiella cryophila]
MGSLCRVGAGVFAVTAALALGSCGARPQAGSPPSATSSGSPSTQVSSESPVRKLDEAKRQQVAKARQEGRKTMLLMVFTEPGATEKVTTGLRELGATVEVSDGAVGYLRVEVPLDAVERAAALPSVTSVELDRLIPRDDPTPGVQPGVGPS